MLPPGQKIDYPNTYSVSKLNLFDQCPKQYYFTYLDPVVKPLIKDLKRLPENIWKHYTLGHAVHNAITLFYYLPKEERTEKNLIDGLKETWRSEIEYNQKPPLGTWGGFTSTDEERESYREAIQLLKNFFQIADLNLEIEFIPTRNFFRSIDDYNKSIIKIDTDIFIGGKFDLVIKENISSLKVVDFKTSKRENTDAFQLRFYKILAEKNFNKPVSVINYYYLRSGFKKDNPIELYKNENIINEILSKIQQIKSEKIFNSKPSKLCKFCMFKDLCPSKKVVEDFIESVKEEEIGYDE